MFSKLKNIYDAVGGSDGIKKGMSSVSNFLSNKNEDSPTESTPDKKESDSTHDTGQFSPEFERLINMVIEDGNITDEEMELIKARAEKEGIDPLECQLVIKRRIRRKQEEIERSKNPINAISEAFKIAEASASGGKSTIDGGALSAALALIPGVGQVASVAGLASSLIKTPSNLNSLKAEIISHAAIPEEENLLADFMMFCFNQREMELQRQHASSNSISGMLSSMTMGKDLNLIPIWTTKLNQLISRSKNLYPNSQLIKDTIAAVYESPATALRKLKAQNPEKFYEELENITAPEDNVELLEVVAFLYELAADDDEIKEQQKKLYGVAERRFAGNDQLLQKLKGYKIKRFGLF